MKHANSQHHAEPKNFWGSRYSIGLIVLGAIAVYFLVTEHRAHFLGSLPFLLVLACPLIHVFMHRGHGGHRGPDGGDGNHHYGRHGPDVSAAPPPPKPGDQS